MTWFNDKLQRFFFSGTCFIVLKELCEQGWEAFPLCSTRLPGQREDLYTVQTPRQAEVLALASKNGDLRPLPEVRVRHLISAAVFYQPLPLVVCIFRFGYQPTLQPISTRVCFPAETAFLPMSGDISTSIPHHAATRRLTIRNFSSTVLRDSRPLVNVEGLLVLM